MKRLELSLSLLLALGALAALAPGHAFGQPVEYVPGEVLVGLQADTADTAAVSAVLVSDVGVVAGRQPALRALRVRLHPGVPLQAALARLQARRGVRYAEPNLVRYAVATPNDTYYGSQYAPKKVQADLSWDLWNPQRKVVAAVIDTGVDYTHPDLVDVLDRDSLGNVVGHNALTGTTDARDDHGHGTHVAGTIAARINNGAGVVGIAGWNPTVPGSEGYVKIMPVKVLSASGSGTDAGVADGIVWAADHGAQVLNMSLGAAGSSTTLSDAVTYAWSKGCVVVAAAGNDGVSSEFYPAAYPDAIAVAATDSSDTLASFSNYGAWVDTAAPGVSVLSTLRGGSYGYMSGTSMATPHVSGEAAALMAHAPNLTNSQVRALIVTQVDAYTPYAGRTLGAGAGRINVYRALQATAGVGSALTSLVVSPSSVTGGVSSTGTVTLTGAAPAGGVTVSLSSNNAAATVPASVLVPEGATTAAFSIGTTPLTTSATATITASDGTETRTASLTVKAVALYSLTVSPISVAGGVSSTGTVTLTGAAPAGGVTVSLSSNNAAATVPASVLVPAGLKTAKFTVTTTPVLATATATLKAVYAGVIKSATLSVKPPALYTLAISPTSVTGGASSTGTVTLTGPATPGGVIVTLASGNAAASVPASVTVPGGQKSATFPITTAPVAANTSVSISATYLAVKKAVTLTVKMPAVSLVTVSPASVTGGMGSTATVTLTGAAPAGGKVVTLSSSNTAVATVPASVTVPEGQKTATFPVTSKPASANTYANINAAAGGVWKYAKLTVYAPKLTTLTVSPSTVPGGTTAVGTVTLDGPAPAAGFSVALTSSSTTVATVPASVTVPAGANTVSFTVTTKVVTAIKTVTLTASKNGISRTTVLTVTP